MRLTLINNMQSTEKFQRIKKSVVIYEKTILEVFLKEKPVTFFKKIVT